MATATVEERYTTEAVLRRYASLLDSLATKPAGLRSLPAAPRPGRSATSAPTSHVATPKMLRDIDRQGD